MPRTKQLRGARSPRIKAPVTQDIIDRAVPRDSGHCMIADAIRAIRPDAIFVAVDLATIRFTEGDRRYVYLTPRTGQRALIAFDHGEKIEPFNLRLENAHVLQAGHGARRKPAELKGTRGAGVPVRVNGAPPPAGPLSNVGTNRGNVTGKRREFGLRASLR